MEDADKDCVGWGRRGIGGCVTAAADWTLRSVLRFVRGLL